VPLPLKELAMLCVHVVWTLYKVLGKVCIDSSFLSRMKRKVSCFCFVARRFKVSNNFKAATFWTLLHTSAYQRPESQMFNAELSNCCL
jgi:hypothetical protein